MSVVRFSFFIFLFSLLLLAGCSRGYRRSLEVWLDAEPTSYLQNTLEWTQAAEKQAVAAQPEPPVSIGPAEIASPADKETQIVAELLQTDVSRIQDLREQLDESEELDRAFDSEIDWSRLSLAVAIRNPAARAAGQRWEAAVRQYDQAEYLEQLIAQYRSFTRYLKVEAGKPLHRSMTQSFFPFSGAAALKGELVDRQVKLAELEWRQILRDRIVEAGIAFFDIQYLDRAAATTEENVRLVENVLSVVEERYRAGRADQADLLKVQTELERQRNMLNDLTAQRSAAAARINGLLDRPADARVGPARPHDLPDRRPAESDLLATALEHRQEIRLARLRLERTGAAIQLAEAMNRPTATQGYSQFERGTGAEASVGESKTSFGLDRKFPDRPDYAQAEAYLAEMRRRRAALASQWENALAQTRALARVRIEELDEARREVELIDEIVLPQNRSTYETMLSAYSSGRRSFLDLFDAERELIRARLESHAARRDLNRALLRLVELTGRFNLSSD